MKVTDAYRRAPCASILVERDRRQRRAFTTEDLKPSIAARGVLSPIIVEERPDGALALIAGERRLTASIELGLPDIPIRLASELSPVEAQIIELEENLKRQDLSWQDQARAIAGLHALYQSDDPEWTQAATALAIGVTPSLVSMTLRVARDLAQERIAGAPNLNAAHNMLARVDSRKLGDMASDIIAAGIGIVTGAIGAFTGASAASAGSPVPGVAPGAVGPAIAPGSGVLAPPPAVPIAMPPPPPESILNESFLTWAPTYSGPKFNFVHCDFPYGKNVFKGELSGRDKWLTYDDSPELYWELIDCFCANLDRFMAYSAHLMFWLSADIETLAATVQRFAERAPELTFQSKALIWHKTDNVGVLADPKRGPRHVYETALIASRGDRQIVKAVSDVYGSPTDKRHHHSTKSQPMLEHYFQMFVDETTTLLDPTCGGGSSLRAAEARGAASVLGLEIDPEHYANANSALRQFRTLRKVSA